MYCGNCAFSARRNSADASAVVRRSVDAWLADARIRKDSVYVSDSEQSYCLYDASLSLEFGWRGVRAELDCVSAPAFAVDRMRRSLAGLPGTAAALRRFSRIYLLHAAGVVFGVRGLFDCFARIYGGVSVYVCRVPCGGAMEKERALQPVGRALSALLLPCGRSDADCTVCSACRSFVFRS